MFWHDSKKEKPQHSTAMYIHRVLVWYNGAWATGYFIGAPLMEWRLDNSPSRFTDKDMPFWAEVSAPLIDDRTDELVDQVQYNGFDIEFYKPAVNNGQLLITVANPKAQRESIDIHINEDITSLSCDFGTLHEPKRS